MKMKKICFILLLSSLIGWHPDTAQAKKTYSVPADVQSSPTGAKVYFQGQLICASTPGTVVLKLSKEEMKRGIDLTFRKEGYPDGTVHATPTETKIGFFKVTDPMSIAYEFPQGSAYAKDPTIPAGEAKNRVSRDNAGQTELERTIIRWAFDSDPRGARIFWRVISSVPSEVKNTNETWLGTLPFEETRSFNIQGLTYENARDVQIEIKVTKNGYEPQVKRFNVRQAIDQQEISSFFEMVKKEE